MQRLDCFRSFISSREANEREASGAARFAVLGDVDIHDLADFAKELAKLLVRRGKVEVPYEYLV